MIRPRLAVAVAAVAVAAVLLLPLATVAAPAQVPEPPSARHDIRFYRVAHGFQPEVMDAAGLAAGNGFAHPNRWGQYTAYLMLTGRGGERTWRIEHYLPYPGQNFAQGSTMYLLEGRQRALLIDTANPAAFTPGVDDLKTVVRYLLGHDDKGRALPHPLDFVVANTHNHGDHIGENALMSDRTVYYMDGDWPAAAPANYVPIREGGGATAHSSGAAVATIDLGGRVLRAIAVPPHTPGSTAYLDADNRLLFSGDAIGSAWPWIQFAPFDIYARTLHHLDEVSRPNPDLVVLPAHFYQVRSWGRAGPPLFGRPLDRQYILDQMALADGVLAGTVIGEPYPWQHSAFWAHVGSARAVYSLYLLGQPGDALPIPYHAVRIGGGFPREWTLTTPPPAQDINRLSDIAAEVYLIREQDGPSLYLIKGSQAALLIGTGTGRPGLASLIRRLIGDVPLDVALPGDDSNQTGGLHSLAPRTVFVAAGGHGGTALADGATLRLGSDGAGRSLVLEAQTMRSGKSAWLTLRIIADRLLFTGPALGRRSLADVRAASIAPFRIDDPVAYQIGLTRWSAHTTGRYDSVLGSGSADWYLSPDYVTQLEQALTKANTGKGDATVARRGDDEMLVQSAGPADIKALISVPTRHGE